jgi:hypothetical protein
VSGDVSENGVGILLIPESEVGGCTSVNWSWSHRRRRRRQSQLGGWDVPNEGLSDGK